LYVLLFLGKEYSLCSKSSGIHHLPTTLQGTDYWKTVVSLAAPIVFKYIEGLRTQIGDTSKRNSWYLYFNYRALTEKRYYTLKILVTGLMLSGIFPQNSVSRQIVVDLFDGLQRNERRFAKSKFYKFFSSTLAAVYKNPVKTDFELVSRREFENNYELDFLETLEAIFTVRWNTPRRVKKQQFRRGYHDKGSKSSESEIARRAANREEFCFLDKEYRKMLQRMDDPIAQLRKDGYLPLEE
jgi:hypothetical protein